MKARDEKRIEELTAAFRAGWDNTRMAAHFGYASQSSLRARLSHLGLIRVADKNARARAISQRHAEGVSIADLKTEFNAAAETIRRAIRDFPVEPPAPSRRLTYRIIPGSRVPKREGLSCSPAAVARYEREHAAIRKNNSCHAT